MRYLLTLALFCLNLVLFSQKTHYKIRDMGYISMPKELKLKTGELHNVSDASLSALHNKYNYEITGRKIIFLQDILSNIDSAKTKFAKFSIEISECEDLNIDSMDRQEVHTFDDTLRKNCKEKLQQTGEKILSWYGLQKTKLAGITALKLSYLKQKSHDFKIIRVNICLIYKSARKYTIVFCYPNQDQNKWKPIYNEILKSIYIE